MIKRQSVVGVVDNSGMKAVCCMSVHGGSRPRFPGRVGDVMRASVQVVKPGAGYKAGDLVLGLIVRSRRPSRLGSGLRHTFSDNGVVIVDATGAPRATRVLGPVPRQVLRKLGYGKVLSMAGAGVA
jgi:large subunit ribosomal protein L14